MAVLLCLFAVLLGALAVFGVAFAREANRGNDLEAQNEKILSDHESIGKAFAQQTRKLTRQSPTLERALRNSYNQGFSAGEEAVTIPSPLRKLARQAAAGLLVPRRLPEPLNEARLSIEAQIGAYAIRWPSLAALRATSTRFACGPGGRSQAASASFSVDIVRTGCSVPVA